jgi:hypothetical protein
VARSLIVSAPKVRLYINGQPFGRVVDFSWSSEIPRRPLHCVDQLDPIELIPGPARCSGSISVVKVVNDGGAESAGIVAPFTAVSLEKYFSLTLVDIVSDNVIFNADQCSLTSQSWQVPSRGTVRGNFVFEALNWGNGQGTVA